MSGARGDLPALPPEFIVAVTGSRGITPQEQVWNVLDGELTELIVAGHKRILFRLGDATGVDLLALRWARERGVRRRIFFADPRGYNSWAATASIENTYAPELSRLAEESAVLASDWDRDGNSAGPARNAAMIGILEPTYLPLADLCVAIWADHSRGTNNMIATARNAHVDRVIYEAPDYIRVEEHGDEKRIQTNADRRAVHKASS